jgi:hypothetical protein
MTYNKWDCLDSLQLLLGSEFLSLELDLIFLDVVLLDCEELQVLVQLLKFGVEVLLL